MSRLPKMPVAVIVLAFGILSARALWAGEHPVPLEKDVDAAKCLECHEDKSKGKNVHSAIAMGCTTCHEVKTEGETTTINLNQPKEQLCFSCHANEAKETDTKHGPWEKGQCVLCHDPHTSDYRKQLRADGNKLCLECHNAARGELPATVKLFGSHEVKSDDLDGMRRLRLSTDETRGHPLGNHWISTIPDPTRSGAKMECLTCHVPHSSTEDKLARIWTIKDKAGQDKRIDACNACHDAYDRQAVEERARRAPEIERRAHEAALEAARRREEYQRRLPKLGPAQ